MGPKEIHIARIREVQCETYNAKYPNPHEAKAPFAGPCERGQGPGRKKEEEKEEELPQPGGRRVSATHWVNEKKRLTLMFMLMTTTTTVLGKPVLLFPPT